MTQKLSDFDRVKQAVSIRDALSHYYPDIPEGVQLRLLPQCCDYDKKSLSVELSKGVFKCFHCESQGNIFDLVMAFESSEASTPRAAMLLLADRHSVDVSKHKKKKAEPPAKPKLQFQVKPVKKTSAKDTERTYEVNAPLSFTLKDVDTNYEYSPFTRIGKTLGIGLNGAKRGSTAGKFVLPIHNAGGELIAYAAFDHKDGVIRIDYPKGFAPDLEVFNLHRAVQLEPDELEDVVVVDGLVNCLNIMEEHHSKGNEALVLCSLIGPVRPMHIQMICDTLGVDTVNVQGKVAL